MTTKKSPKSQTLPSAAPAVAAPAGDTLPAVLTLSQSQQDYVRTLVPQPDTRHTAKVHRAVDAAFTESVLEAIASVPDLGGSARADEIRAMLTRLHACVDISRVVAPIDRIAGENILADCAELGAQLTDILLIARRLQRRQPQVLARLADAANWVRANRHNGTRKSPAATGATPVSPQGRAPGRRKATAALPHAPTPPSAGAYQGPAVSPQPDAAGAPNPAQGPAIPIQGPAIPRTG